MVTEDTPLKMSHRIEASTLIRRNERVVSRSLAGQTGAVLLNLDTSAYHGVNEVGELVWDLVSDGITFNHLIAKIQEQLEAVPPSLVDDITAFLADLSARDLVVLESGPPCTT
jgi:Coenzyme PQQ synthesis protein D (PqqD)